MRPVFCLVAAALAAPLAATAVETSEAADPPATPPAEPQTRWEGAIGLRSSYAPSYQGAAGSKLKLTPGFFFRYGRFTITNSGGFVTRRADDVVRGLAVDLSPGSRLRVNLALRVDQGRGEDSDPALKGMGTIRPTIRARLNYGYALDDGWKLGGSWSIDALGRGGGSVGDIGVTREVRTDADTVWTFGSGVSLAGSRYMQTWYGVSEEQAARSGYPVYTPGAGLRDVSAFINFRKDLDDRWLLIGGAGANRLVGPPVDSPLTKNRNGWGANVGLAWRF